MKNLSLALTVLVTLFTSTVASATNLSWQELGGANYYGKYAPYLSRSPHLTFAPITVGKLERIDTDMLLTANVGTQNSDFYIWASAEVDGVWKIFAKTGILPLTYGSSAALEFSIFEEISGTITGLHFDTKFQSGEGDFSNMFSTRLEFADAVTTPVPEPETYAMMLAGLGLLGVFARRRKQNG